MGMIIWLIFALSFMAGVLSGINYLIHPLAGSRFITYTGGKFWLVAFICIIVLYLR